MNWLTRLALLVACSGLMACGGDAPIGLDPDAGDSGVAPDDSGMDGSTPDSGMDGSTPDSGMDGGTPDSGMDGSTPDSGMDGSTPDSGMDGGACPDADGDGVTVCDGDCDDADPLTYPGAAEVCGDGVDNACGSAPDPAALCSGIGTFVSALTGSDATGTGTRDNPVQTIGQGIANAVTLGGGMNVIVAEGTYAETVTMVEGVSILGGFQCSTGICDWSHDPTAHEAIIDAAPAVGVSIGVDVTRSTVLDGFTVEGPAMAVAIAIEGGAPTLSNLVVNGLGGGIRARDFLSGAGVLTPSNPRITTSTVRGGGLAGIDLGGGGEVTASDVRGAPGIFVASEGTPVTLRENTIHSGDGAHEAISCFSSALVTIDRNHINTDGSRVGTCTGRPLPFEMCAGISVAGGGDYVITNNVIVGAPSAASVALAMLDVEVPIGTVNVHSNTLYGSIGAGGAGSMSAAIGCASQFGIAVFGSVRNNILLGGDGATSYGFFEQDEPSGRSCHPIVFENNDTFDADVVHRQWSGSAIETLLTDISAVNALSYAQDNLGVDPALDPTDHLTVGSPCIDVGTGTAAPTNDIDGDARPSGPGYDIGADERNAP